MLTQYTLIILVKFKGEDMGYVLGILGIGCYLIMFIAGFIEYR